MARVVTVVGADAARAGLDARPEAAATRVPRRDDWASALAARLNVDTAGFKSSLVGCEACSRYRVVDIVSLITLVEERGRLVRVLLARVVGKSTA